MNKKKDRKSLPIEKRREMNAAMLVEFEDLKAKGGMKIYEIRQLLAKKYHLTHERAVEQTLRREIDKRRKKDIKI